MHRGRDQMGRMNDGKMMREMGEHGWEQGGRTGSFEDKYIDHDSTQ